MRAAAKVELRMLLGHWPMRGVLVLALLAPVLLVGLEWSASLAGPAEHHHRPYWTYSMAFGFATAVMAFAVALVATRIGTQTHRHRVFQALAVTGHPRDVMLTGRLLAALAVTTVLGVLVFAEAIAIHVLTWPPPVRQFMMYERGDALSALTWQQVAGDGAGVALLLVATTAFLVGLSTITRSVAATIGVIGAYLLLESLAVDWARSRWYERASNVPLERMHDVPVAFVEPWWSVKHAVPALIYPSGGGAVSAALLLFGWALLACTVAMHQLVRRDA